jgi:hypothetical protein
MSSIAPPKRRLTPHGQNYCRELHTVTTITVLPQTEQTSKLLRGSKPSIHVKRALTKLTFKQFHIIPTDRPEFSEQKKNFSQIFLNRYVSILYIWFVFLNLIFSTKMEAVSETLWFKKRE